MEIQITSFFWVLLICLSCAFAESGEVKKFSKLFVFGDSYVDTGNTKKPTGSWKEPYGITFPGKPAGRFSDGRVLTDFIASFLGIQTPIAFEQRKRATNSSLRNGMNFAYGGTGVFDTLTTGPNMTIQINFFQQLLEEKVYTQQDLHSSTVLVSTTGNDYISYLFKNGSFDGLQDFTTSLVNQLSMDLKRIHELGVQKILVTGLPPVGCLPAFSAALLYQSCLEDFNNVSRFHNRVLEEAVQKLNNEDNNYVFQVLDLVGAFKSVVKKANNAGNLEFSSPILKPCCVGVSSNYLCGDLENGAKKYEVCHDPKSAIFWDNLHPTQNGWQGVYLALKSNLHRIYPGNLS